VPTVAVKAMIIVSNKLSSDLVYMLTKALFENRAEIALNHLMGAYLDEADAIKGITVPFHPGAERYFREIGLM
ncbi:MAG: hypothetical protein LBG68_05070, partial [Coriobacteriales bacterium]|nr:hypothetical protein [Coriobacteriales bacterium]